MNDPEKKIVLTSIYAIKVGTGNQVLGTFEASWSYMAGDVHDRAVAGSVVGVAPPPRLRPGGREPSRCPRLLVRRFAGAV